MCIDADIAEIYKMQILVRMILFLNVCKSRVVKISETHTHPYTHTKPLVILAHDTVTNL